MIPDVVQQLADTQRAFDAVAAVYDGPVGNNRLVQAMRTRTLALLRQSVPSGATLLDLGCGTGIDAVSLGRSGYRVVAIDSSGEMVQRTRYRVRNAGLQDVVAAQQVGIQELDRLGRRTFDGAYSNLGALNCVPDLGSAAQAIAAMLRSGGPLVASVMGRICPWEIGLFTIKRQWARIRVRSSKDAVPVPLRGRTVWTRYSTPSEFRSAFANAGFSLQSLRCLGLLVPPPFMLAFAERHPDIVARLQYLEDRVAAWPGLRRWGDHFLIVMRRDA